MVRFRVASRLGAAALAALVVAGCTFGGGPHGVVGSASPTTPATPRSGPTATPTASAAPRAGLLTQDEAAAVVRAYGSAVRQARKARSVKATRKIESGPLLTISLAQYRMSRQLGLKATKADRLDSNGVVIPPADSGKEWFIDNGFSDARFGNVVSLYQRSGSSGPWRKSMQVWVGGGDFPVADPDWGVFEAADASGFAQARTATQRLARYLAGGRKPAKTKVGALSDVRALLKASTRQLSFASSSVTCRPAAHAAAAVATVKGTAFLTTMSCAVTYSARSAYTLFLKPPFSALASRSSGLRWYQTRFLTQVAATVSASGQVKVVGASNAMVAVRTG